MNKREWDGEGICRSANDVRLLRGDDGQSAKPSDPARTR